MICEPITCTGNDLAKTCEEIRSRGGSVSQLDTGIGGKPAMYRVSYFERESRPAQADDSPVLSTGALNHLTNKPHHGSSGTMQSRPDSARTVKVIRQVPGHNAQRNVAAGGETRAEKPESVPDAPASISIEDRIAALQSKLLAGGKIKRSKPKTMPDNYRSPYAD